MDTKYPTNDEEPVVEDNEPRNNEAPTVENNNQESEENVAAPPVDMVRREGMMHHRHHVVNPRAVS